MPQAPSYPLEQRGPMQCPRPPRKPVYLMRHHNLDKIPPPNQHVTLEAKRKLRRTRTTKDEKPRTPTRTHLVPNTAPLQPRHEQQQDLKATTHTNHNRIRKPRPTKIIAKGKLPIHTYNPQIGDHGKQRPLAPTATTGGWPLQKGKAPSSSHFNFLTTTEKTLRSLPAHSTSSGSFQTVRRSKLQGMAGDGLSHYPVRIVDNRPQYMQMPSSVPDGVEQGDTLFAQPSHLTSATAPSSSASAIMHSGDRPHNLEPDLLDTADLDLEANRAIAQGQAPAWSISGHESTMRASIRVGEISFDIAWTPGAGPPTIPPSMPLAPHTVLTLKGSALGAWRGHVWTPSQGDVIRHPPRVAAAPTIVAYRPLNTPPKGPALPSAVCMTLWEHGLPLRALNLLLRALRGFG